MAKVKKAKQARRENGPYSKTDAMSDEIVSETLKNVPTSLDSAMSVVVEEAKRKLSRKEQRRLELKIELEKSQAAEAEVEAGLPVEEQTRRRLRRNQLAEYRAAKKRIAELKKQRGKLGKKKVHERETKKSINAKIRSILDNLKAKHQAEWTLAGFDAQKEAINTQDMMEE